MSIMANYWADKADKVGKITLLTMHDGSTPSFMILIPGFTTFL